jgi:hypothetical protein
MQFNRVKDGYPKKGAECVITDGYSYKLVEYIGEDKWEDIWTSEIYGESDEWWGFGSKKDPINKYIELPKLP